MILSDIFPVTHFVRPVCLKEGSSLLTNQKSEFYLEFETTLWFIICTDFENWIQQSFSWFSSLLDIIVFRSFDMGCTYCTSEVPHSSERQRVVSVTRIYSKRYQIKFGIPCYRLKCTSTWYDCHEMMEPCLDLEVNNIYILHYVVFS